MRSLPAADIDHILEQTRDVWRQLDGARIFITGGTGFFGRWLLETLVCAVDRLGVHVSAAVLTRSPERFLAKAPHLAAHRAVSLVQGDVRWFVFPDGRFSHVIHGATDASPKLNRERPEKMRNTIVDGTERVLQFSREAGVKRLLFVSSGAVYQAAGSGSAYAEGKMAAEALCRASGVACSIARCFAFVGPHLPLDGHFAIGNFISDCLGGRPIEIRGDGTAVRSYLYAADLAVWLWTILADGAAGAAYDVGSERAVTIADLAKLVAAEIEPETRITVQGLYCPGGGGEHYVPSTDRARKELGLLEWIGLEDAIRRTAEWAACEVHA